MLVIRMRRVGTTKKPFFRVVVTEAKTAGRAASSRTSGPTSAFEASEGGDQQGAPAALAEARRAAVGFGAHVDREAPFA
jgi:hypothetical protein